MVSRSCNFEYIVNKINNINNKSIAHNTIEINIAILKLYLLLFDTVTLLYIVEFLTLKDNVENKSPSVGIKAIKRITEKPVYSGINTTTIKDEIKTGINKNKKFHLLLNKYFILNIS